MQAQRVRLNNRATTRRTLQQKLGLGLAEAWFNQQERVSMEAQPSTEALSAQTLFNKGQI